MTPEQPENRKPEYVLAFAPALFLFIGIYTHVLLLLAVGVVLAAGLLKSSRATRIWGAVAIAIALIAGIALWEPTQIAVPRR